MKTWVQVVCKGRQVPCVHFTQERRKLLKINLGAKVVSRTLVGKRYHLYFDNFVLLGFSDGRSSRRQAVCLWHLPQRPNNCKQVVKTHKQLHCIGVYQTALLSKETTSRLNLQCKLIVNGRHIS